MSVYIENFETIFGATNNIQALRNKVLELAIQGKLVEQDSEDEPARVLVKKINVERDRLVKEGKIKRQQPLPMIEEDEIPFQVPKSWVWVKSGEICSKINYGFTASAIEAETGVKLLRITDIQDGKVDWDSVPYCEIGEDKIQQYLLNKNDIVIARTGGTVGKSFIIRNVESKAVYASYLIRMIPSKELNPEFYYILLNSPLYWSQLDEGARGGAQPNVNAQTLSNLILPLPPQTEQKRIVQKVEYLMSEIDKLEEYLQKQDHINELLPKAVVDAIGSCKTGEELKEQLKFVLENFETVFQTSDSMQQLRNVVLQLAIEGKLVQQDPTDESASKLVKRIQVERDKLVKEGKIKQQQPLLVIEEEDVPFEIPQSWEWGHLGTVIDDIYGGGTPDKSNPQYWNGTIKWASVKDFGDTDKFLNDTIDSITDDGLNNSSSKIVKKGDFIISTRMGLGRIVITNIDVAINQDLKGVLLSQYFDCSLFYYFYKTLKIEGTGTTVKGIKQNELLNILIPIPPLEEQYRIVTKIESIMTLIDQMERELRRKADLVGKMASM